MKWRPADLTDDDDLEALAGLHREIFGTPTPLPDFSYGGWWFLEDDNKDVGFCGAVRSNIAGGMYLKRCAMIDAYRGRGLQFQAIRLRERWARREGLRFAVTDCTHDNVSCANTLIRAGYRMWLPATPWGLKASVYWRRRLLPKR